MLPWKLRHWTVALWLIMSVWKVWIPWIPFHLSWVSYYGLMYHCIALYHFPFISIHVNTQPRRETLLAFVCKEKNQSIFLVVMPQKMHQEHEFINLYARLSLHKQDLLPSSPWPTDQTHIPWQHKSWLSERKIQWDTAWSILCYQHFCIFSKMLLPARDL